MNLKIMMLGKKKKSHRQNSSMFFKKLYKVQKQVKLTNMFLLISTYVTSLYRKEREQLTQKLEFSLGKESGVQSVRDIQVLFFFFLPLFC